MSSSSDPMFSKANIVLSAILSLVVAAHAAPSTNPGGPIIISCKSPNATIEILPGLNPPSKAAPMGIQDVWAPGIPVNLLAELTSIFQAPRASNAAKPTSMKAQCKPFMTLGVLHFLNAAIVVSRSPAAIYVLS